jgi:hypothetical protein
VERRSGAAFSPRGGQAKAPSGRVRSTALPVDQRSPGACFRRMKRRGEAPSPERVVRVLLRPEPRQRSRIFEHDAFTGQQADLLAPAADIPAMAGGEPRLGAGAIPLPAAGVTPVSIQVPAETRRSSEQDDCCPGPTSPHQPLVMISLRCGDWEIIAGVGGASGHERERGDKPGGDWGSDVGSRVTYRSRSRFLPCARAAWGTWHALA